MKKFKSIILLGLLPLIGSMFVSCEEEDVDTDLGASIGYMITMSPDLLKFVYPEVTYVDSNGNLHKISGVKELDSLVNYNVNSIPGNVIITKQEIKGTNYKCWTLNLFFDNLPFHSYMGVKYKKLDFVEDTTGIVFDFHHSIYTTTISSSSSIISKTKWIPFITNPSTSYGFISTGVVTNYISFTKTSYYKGGEVEEYINNLVNTPDKVGFYIDDKGTFTERDDFTL